jgi:hypothetical protein
LRGTAENENCLDAFDRDTRLRYTFSLTEKRIHTFAEEGLARASGNVRDLRKEEEEKRQEINKIK